MGKWIHHKKGWLRGYHVKHNNDHETIEVIEDDEADKMENDDTVIFIRPRCRGCGNADHLKCYGAYGKIRYYRCPCGHEFKAVEEER